jgi:threonyl-tRNA synthetase
VDHDAGLPPALRVVLTPFVSPGARFRGVVVPAAVLRGATAKEYTVSISSERASLDHRDINRDLGVFATDPLVGSGLPLWLPAGAIIRHELERLAAEIARGDGCRAVYSPVLAKRALFETSGHWAKFSEDMFPPMRVGGDELVLRPANCPHHAMIYAAAQRSYRELPIRLNELAPMFRAERSGVLSGLTRVRQISLDDTHVFCRPDQVADEVERALRSALAAQRILGLPVHYVRLSRRDTSDRYLGTPAQWRHAEHSLRAAGHNVLHADELGLVEAEGEAAFYGPKLDLQLRDARGHEETIATVQLDFSQPERFDLGYIAADGRRRRVVMIHRGTVGAMERVVAALLERYEGRLPLWLAPVQLCVLPVGPSHDDRARGLLDDALAAGLRATLHADGTLGARVRASRRRRDCVIAVIGDQEITANTVQILDVAANLRASIDPTEVIGKLSQAYAHRSRSIDWSGN